MVYQWLIAAITLGVPAFTGYAILAYTHAIRDRILEAAAGSIFGIAAFGTVLYALAHVIPMQQLAIYVVLAIFAIGCIYTLVLQHHTKRVHTFDRTGLIIAVCAFIVFAIIGSKLLIERESGLYTGIINAYGDIAWHTSLITELAQQKTLPVQDPIFAGIPLTYPFLTNFISSAMIIMGSSLTASVDVPAILLIPITLILIYYFGKLYGSSKKAGIITMLLFLCGGATFGFVRFFPDFLQSGQTLAAFITHLPNRDYSGVGGDTDGYNFLNPVTSLLLPQRAMLFGLPIVLAVLILLHASIRNKKTAIIAGILAGTLPLYHAHACIALAFAIVALIATTPQKTYWLAFFIPALSIGIPELFFYAHGSASAGSFFRFAPWWMKGDKNAILYWVQNTGILLPVGIAALFMKQPTQTKALAISGFALFVLANTFLFAPWAWDNFKLLVFWLLFTLPSIAWLAVHTWNTAPVYSVRAIIIIAIGIQVASGSLDIWKLSLPTATTWQEWDSASITFAHYIQRIVPTTEPILTASVHNSPAVLAGRILFLGYPAHIWSHGVSPWKRESEIKKFYAGEGNTIDEFTPHYIIIGPQERANFPNILIRPSWQKVAEYGPYVLFRQ